MWHCGTSASFIPKHALGYINTDLQSLTTCPYLSINQRLKEEEEDYKLYSVVLVLVPYEDEPPRYRCALQTDCSERCDSTGRMVVSKRSRDDAGGERASKHAKLEDDRIASPQVGANLIQVNGKTCTHEVAWPPGVEGSQLPPGNSAAPAAKEYAFPLDPFQQTAINSLETGKGGPGAHRTTIPKSRSLLPCWWCS